MNLSQAVKINIFAFIIAMAILAGGAYNTYVHYDFSHSPDSKSYMQMARGNFDVNPIHRYRVVVPFVAATVNYPVSMVYKKLWPHRATSDWPLQLSFFIVNLLLMSLFGFLVFRICLAYQLSLTSSFLALVAVLTSRWAFYSAGLPLIDSLYLVVIAAGFLAIKTRQLPYLLLAVILGPFAKESFIFIAPVIFFYYPMNKLKLAILFIIPGLLAFISRYLVDQQIEAESAESLGKAVSHFENILVSVKRIASARGIGELFTVVGVFTFIILSGFLGGKKAILSWLEKMDWPCFWLLVSAIIHALISTSVARMLFIAAPVYALAIGFILDRHELYGFYRKLRGELEP